MHARWEDGEKDKKNGQGLTTVKDLNVGVTTAKHLQSVCSCLISEEKLPFSTTLQYTQQNNFSSWPPCPLLLILQLKKLIWDKKRTGLNCIDYVNY